MTVLPVVNMQLSVYCCVSDKNVHGMRHGGEGIHNHLHIPQEKVFTGVCKTTNIVLLFMMCSKGSI